MPAPRIQVLSPRTWGEFGNYLAATRLARVLADRVDAEVTLLEAERILPWLGEVGAQIRDITVTSPDAATRTDRYLAMTERLVARFPRDAEAGPGAGDRPDLAALVAHLVESTPDVVVATKGFLARLCLAAGRAAARRAG